VNGSLLLSGLSLLAILRVGDTADLLSGSAQGVRTVKATPHLKLNNARHKPDGTLEFQAEWNGQGKVMVESSTDLKEWTNEALGEANEIFSFSNTTWRGVQRFYRARDLLQRIGGIIRDLQTEDSVAGAKVTLSFNDSWLQGDLIAQTDAQGGYCIVAPGEHAARQIVVEKAGYDRLVFDRPVYGSAGGTLELDLWVAPEGYRPPNDDFQNRSRLEGTNVMVAARTFAATSEPENSLRISFDDYGVEYPRNLWWSWTAPKNGAVFIARNRSHDSGVVVYTGRTLQELVRVWDTSDADDAFFVNEGVEYQISFGTIRPADTKFSLKMVDPLPPAGTRAEVGGPFPATPGEDQGGAAILWIQEPLLLYSASNGTSPLKFQWRKNGADIPGATNSTFSIIEVQTADTGAYTVQVSNEAGTVVTKAIQITVLPKRPHLPEVMKGVWRQESSLASIIVTFSDTEFSTRRTADDGFAGRGQYRLIKDRWSYGYQLTMNFSEPQPAVHEFLFRANGEEDDSFRGSITDSEGKRVEVHGSFRRLPQP
jgi:hypothetical protein